MSALSVLLIALSMSADAFAAALAKGAALHRPQWREALRTGLIFGSVEGVTPLIGWAAGRAASRYIAAFDHWLAFVLLAGIGGKMIWDSFRRDEDEEKPQSHSFLVLALTAVGTSIDALAVGVTLALIGAAILVNALAIGAATFTMTTIGILCGHRLGTRLGRHAEAFGGAILILVGAAILAEHLRA
jgi:putative Mn2+ efflux pump MntP